MKYIQNKIIKRSLSKDMWQWLVQHTDIMLDSCHYKNKNLECNTYFWIVCTQVSRQLSLYYSVFRINGVSRGWQNAILSTPSFCFKTVAHKPESHEY